ncbi:prephenate dehydrogenase/arogenate dehydrogenase family protein [Thermoproteota archaeon]
MEIGIIGFGQFGQFAAEHLKKKFDVAVTDKRKLSDVAGKIGVEFVSLEEAASKKIVILATPISTFDKTLEQVKPFLQKDALVIDVCSVKVKPAQQMKKILPSTVRILATHPLFGPQSGKNGVEGLTTVLCPVRINEETVEKVKRLLEKAGLNVLVMSAEEHDMNMAKTQALTHFLASALLDLKLLDGHQKIMTTSSVQFKKAIDLIKDDTPELFRDMQTENPFAQIYREQFIKKLELIHRKL